MPMESGRTHEKSSNLETAIHDNLHPRWEGVVWRLARNIVWVIPCIYYDRSALCVRTSLVRVSLRSQYVIKRV